MRRLERFLRAVDAPRRAVPGTLVQTPCGLSSRSLACGEREACGAGAVVATALPAGGSGMDCRAVSAAGMKLTITLLCVVLWLTWGDPARAQEPPPAASPPSASSPLPSASSPLPSPPPPAHATEPSPNDTAGPPFWYRVSGRTFSIEVTAMRQRCESMHRGPHVNLSARAMLLGYRLLGDEFVEDTSK